MGAPLLASRQRRITAADSVQGQTALALPVVAGVLFMRLPDIGDDQEGPKLVFGFTLLVAMPVLIWALLRTDGHLAGTRRRWLILTSAAWVAGLAPPAYGYPCAIRDGF